MADRNTKKVVESLGEKGTKVSSTPPVVDSPDTKPNTYYLAKTLQDYQARQKDYADSLDLYNRQQAYNAKYFSNFRKAELPFYKKPTQKVLPSEDYEMNETITSKPEPRPPLRKPISIEPRSMVQESQNREIPLPVIDTPTEDPSVRVAEDAGQLPSNVYTDRAEYTRALAEYNTYLSYYNEFERLRKAQEKILDGIESLEEFNQLPESEQKTLLTETYRNEYESSKLYWKAKREGVFVDEGWYSVIGRGELSVGPYHQMNPPKLPIYKLERQPIQLEAKPITDLMSNQQLDIKRMPIRYTPTQYPNVRVAHYPDGTKEYINREGQTAEYTYGQVPRFNKSFQYNK